MGFDPIFKKCGIANIVKLCQTKCRIAPSMCSIEKGQSEPADQKEKRTNYIMQAPQVHVFLLLQACKLKVLDLSLSQPEVAEDDGDGEGEGEGEGDGDGDVPQEEDEGGDSGGYYEDEEADREPYESQPTSDSGHSMPDFTADIDIHKSDSISEEDTKPVSEPEETVENKQGDFQ